MKRIDWIPLALVPLLALLAYPLIGSSSTWLTLTAAGIAMGMIVYITATGLTLVFGLMDVLNFGHGVFISIGAYLAYSVLGTLGDWSSSEQILQNLMAIGVAVAVAMAGTAGAGLAFERVLIRPVYGQHFKQILITMGGLIIGEELIKVIWSPQPLTMALPNALRGALIYGNAAIERYRIFACVVGVVIFGLQLYLLNRTKIGLLIRAGVENTEMVESLGYKIRHLFIGVFVAGAALAGLGGVMWGLYQQTITPQVGSHLNVLIFIVLIIGGLGSTSGALLGAILVGLVANYTGFLAPKVSLFSNIALMAAILLWRPQGIYSMGKH